MFTYYVLYERTSVSVPLTGPCKQQGRSGAVRRYTRPLFCLIFSACPWGLANSVRFSNASCMVRFLVGHSHKRTVGLRAEHFRRLFAHRSRTSSRSGSSTIEYHQQREKVERKTERESHVPDTASTLLHTTYSKRCWYETKLFLSCTLQ